MIGFKCQFVGKLVDKDDGIVSVMSPDERDRCGTIFGTNHGITINSLVFFLNNSLVNYKGE